MMFLDVKNFLFVVLSLTVTGGAFADHNTDASGPKSSEASRPAAETTLRANELNAMTKIFGNVDAVTSAKLPVALDSLMQDKNEEAIAQALTPLMASLDEKAKDGNQIEKAITIAENLKKELEDPSKDKASDPKYEALLDRIIWSAERILGRTSKTADQERSASYKAAFTPLFIARVKENEKRIEKINLAVKDSTAATRDENRKDVLGGEKGLDLKFLWSWLSRNKDSATAKNIFDLASNSISQSSPYRALDLMVGSVAQRIHYKDAASALDLVAARGNAQSYTIVPDAHSKPSLVEEFIAQSDKLVSGTPSGVSKYQPYGGVASANKRRVNNSDDVADTSDTSEPTVE